jgi:hypothetical protein
MQVLLLELVLLKIDKLKKIPSMEMGYKTEFEHMSK